MRKYGPGRGELWFRFWFSVAGLVVLVGVWATGGLPGGPALVEIFGFGGLFLAGTAIWAARRLIRRDHP